LHQQLKVGVDVDANIEFKVSHLIWIGVLSGITVSLVKSIQAGFHLGPVPAVEIYAALLTYLAYMVLGAIGAVFLVDHDARGQKMLKNAFLMGFVAPSFFLALLNHPVTPGSNLQEMIGRIPKIATFFVSSAQAQEPEKSNLDSKVVQLATDKVFVLEKSKVEPSFAAALRKALGWTPTPVNYVFVIGTTDDRAKAVATAVKVNKILLDSYGKIDSWAKVVQPSGHRSFYVTVGDLGTPDKAAFVGDLAKDAALKGLQQTGSEDEKHAAALMLKGQVVDARAMFARNTAD